MLLSYFIFTNNTSLHHDSPTWDYPHPISFTSSWHLSTVISRFFTSLSISLSLQIFSRATTCGWRFNPTHCIIVDEIPWLFSYLAEHWACILEISFSSLVILESFSSIWLSVSFFFISSSSVSLKQNVSLKKNKINNLTVQSSPQEHPQFPTTRNNP